MAQSKGTIIIGGFLGLLPVGGIAWHYIQYVIGFRQMGYDVYYLEDTRLHPIFGETWNDSSETIAKLSELMKSFGLEDRFIYLDELTQRVYGKTRRQYLEICESADIFLNISCSNVIREEYSTIPVRILLDTDPMFTQIQMKSNQAFTSEKGSLNELAAWHTHHFTFGENISNKDCLIPKGPYSWKTTRQPICMDYWRKEEKSSLDMLFTTLMNWKAGKKLNYGGEEWGQKDVTFPIVQDLPKLIPDASFKIAVNQTANDANKEQLNHLVEVGWKIISATEASGDHWTYQNFIKSSCAEISVAKETYVKAKTGWFSDRSACYLASGRPVVAQDTGWSKFYPTGSGLFSFSNELEALEAIRKISDDWKTHSDKAREIANAYFGHEKVLGDLINSL